MLLRILFVTGVLAALGPPAFADEDHANMYVDQIAHPHFYVAMNGRLRRCEVLYANPARMHERKVAGPYGTEASAIRAMAASVACGAQQ
jgi:hypothetical protein